MEISDGTKKMLGAAGVLLAIIIIGYVYMLQNKQSGSPVLTPTSSDSLPIVSATPNATASASPLIGGDKDEHGCIGSAGYSWCEAKKKCIRVFEENCLSVEAIKAILAPKYSLKPSEIFIDINYENTKYASGSISFGQKGAEGGMFLAAKINDKWTIVYDGIGSIDCAKIKQDYQFTPEMLEGFCD